MSLPTPITRKESYLAAIAGEEVQVPEKPITREEAYLAAIAEGGGGGEIIIDPTPTQGSTNAVSSGGTYTALEGKLDASEKGTASGVAELDANGKVLSSQLPSFVDDVVEGYYDSVTDRFYEESTFETVIDPVGGKSWVDIPANKSYRWTGSVYVRVDEGVQIGDTSNSAFRGDWGKALKDTMGTGTLDTTAQTVIPAINELKENIPTLKTATGNPITLTDAVNTNAEELSMTIEPIQDLHGYSKPWPAGGGKNLLPMTVDGIKALNSTVQWSGNTTTVNGVTITILTNDGNNVTGVNFNGTATANLSFTFSQLIKGYGDTLLNSGVNFSGGDLTLWIAGWYQGGNAFYGRFFQKNDGSDAAVDIDSVSDNCYVGVGIVSGYTIDLTFKPMMRLATETDPTFAPYSNICPISGLTSGEVETTDGTNTNTATITFGQTVYGGSVDFKTGEVTVTHGYHKITSSDEVIKSSAPGIQSGRAGYWLGNQTSWLADIKFSGGDTNPNNISMLSNCYDIGTTSAVQAVEANNFTVGIGQASGASSTVTNLWFNVSATDCPDIQSFINWITSINFEVVYPLATPTTLTLTPAELELLKGNNTITANGAEIGIEYYPDNAIGALAEKVDDKADKPTSTANGGFIPLWNATNGKLNYYSDGAKQFGVTIESGNPKLRSQSSSSTYANFSASGYEHIASYKSIAVTAENGIVGSGNGGYNFNLSREKLSYLNNITSDVQTQITGLDTRVTALEEAGGGVSDFVQIGETASGVVTSGTFNAMMHKSNIANYSEFMFVAYCDDGSAAVPAPIMLNKKLVQRVIDNSNSFSVTNGTITFTIKPQASFPVNHVVAELTGITTTDKRYNIEFYGRAI